MSQPLHQPTNCTTKPRLKPKGVIGSDIERVEEALTEKEKERKEEEAMFVWIWLSFPAFLLTHRLLFGIYIFDIS
jgi:hypothetical protein